jgi:hypothetical protein
MMAATTRRGALAMLACTPMAASASPLAWTESPFRAAAARLAAASAAMRAYTTEVYTPAEEEFWAAQRRRDAARAAVPHSSTRLSYWNVLNGQTTLSTRDAVQVQMARLIVADPTKYCPPDVAPEYLATMRELIGLADERDIALAAVDRDHPIPPDAVENDELHREEDEALEALIACPVSNFAEFVEKFAILRDWGLTDEDHGSDAILRDVASLAGAA